MTNVYILLKEFSETEVKSFRKFISSPYHNKSRKLVILYNEIIKHYPKFTDEKLTKENLYKKICPGLKYKDSTVRNLMADLHHLLEKFLIVEEAFEDEYEKNYLLLRSLEKKRTDDLFHRILKTTKSMIEKNGVDHFYFNGNARIEQFKYNYSLLNEKERSVKAIKGNAETVHSLLVWMTSFYVTEILTIHMKLVIADSKFNIGEKSGFSDKLIDALDIDKMSSLIKKVDKNNFFLDLYKSMHLTFKHTDERHYYQDYKALISKHSKRLSRDELSTHYTMCIIYCTFKNSQSESTKFFENELFGIYNTFLKEKLFIDTKTNFIDTQLYINIIVLAIRLKKYSWLLDFIAGYSKYLHPDIKENITNYAYSRYYLHIGSEMSLEKHINNSLNHLKEIREESFVLKYDIKTLYLMVYFELGYFENLHSVLKNYRQFLHRNKLVPIARKKKLTANLKVLEKLSYWKEGDPNVDVPALSVNVRNLDPGLFRIWLEENIIKLEQKTTHSKLKHG